MKPRFESIPLATGLRWLASAGLRFEEKMDGVFEELPLPALKLEILGERMLDGRLFAFDVRGAGLERAPLRERLAVLDSIPGLLRPATGAGGEFLEAILAHGGEGVVCKSLDALPGVAWLKCKRTQVYYGIIRELNGSKGGVRVDLLHPSAVEPSTTPGFEAVKFEDFLTGDNGGWVALRGRFESVKIGDVLKLEAYGQHPSGLLREARLDKDFPGSWLIRGR
jgi:hypothetical protein